MTGKSSTQAKLHERNRRGQNWIMVIVGETGVGKSWAATRLAQMMDPTFTADRICFEPAAFMDQVETLPKTSVLVYDDAGLTYGGATWYDEVNMVLGYTMQSYRYRVINTIFTLPQRKLLDRIGRGLCHYMVIIKRHGQGRLYRLRYDEFWEKIMFKTLADLHINKPADMAMVEEYEENKHLWLQDKYGEYKEVLIARRQEQLNQMKQQKPLDALASEVMGDLDKYLDKKGKVSASKIMVNMGLGKNKAYLVRAAVKERSDE